MLKSRDVMRFVVGYYTERLQDLEIALEKVVNDRATKLATSEQIKAFLLQFGYGTEADIQAELGEVSEELAKARTEQAKVRDSFSQDTHFVDQLRVKLREMSVRLGEEDQALADQQRRRTEYQSLKAELITARFKLVRMQTATEVLSKVTFERCPICGNPVDPPDPSDLSKCVLCHKPPVAPDQSQPPEQSPSHETWSPVSMN